MNESKSLCIDSLPEHFLQYLYMQKTTDEEIFKKEPELIDNFLVIKHNDKGFKLDFYLGQISILKKMILKKKYNDEFDYHVCDLTTSPNATLDLVKTYKIDISFCGDLVTAQSSSFSSTGSISDLGTTVLRTALKCVYSSSECNVPLSLADVMDEYSNKLKIALNKRIVLH